MRFPWFRFSRKNNNALLREAWRPSIRFYLILMNLVLLLLLFPPFSIFFLNKEAAFRDVQLERVIDQMNEELEAKSASLVRSIALSASQAIAGYEFTFLNTMVREVVDHDPEIDYCLIMDDNSRAIVHSDPRKFGTVLDAPGDLQISRMIEQKFLKTRGKSKVNIGEVLHHRTVYLPTGETNGREVLEAVVPIYSGTKFVGVLRCGYSLFRLNHDIQAARTEWANKLSDFKLYLFTMTFVFLSIGILVASLFTRALINSLDILNKGVHQVAEGDLDYDIPPAGMVCSEFIGLADGMNTMTARLHDSYQQLGQYSRSLEGMVDERTRELKEAHANLLQQAHEAGMAEMAVGILHNVGNAMTPAKVGTSNLLKKLTDSPVRNHLGEMMKKVGSAFETQRIPDDDEMNRLQEIIRLIPESVREEYDMTITELQKVQEKYEHIENIISLQMRYAKIQRDFEAVDVKSLVDDSLTILQESLDKRSIEVRQSFSKVPPVRIEQGKMVQIVINILKNAYEAMEETPIEQRKMDISIYHDTESPGFVILSVKDYGEGFTPAEKKKMFTFGYTTKAKGAGVGLHSCANYLIANNGSLEAKSEGKGKGAEFVLHLPLAQKNTMES